MRRRRRRRMMGREEGMGRLLELFLPGRGRYDGRYKGVVV